MAFKLPSLGFVFWPVGTGDSTTIVVKKNVVIQMDIHHLSASEDEEDKRADIVDRLVELLPQVDGEPYLSLFILTHPDKDHCLGFKNLLSRVRIGEIWFSPRIFREYGKDLCEDAKAFKKEAQRRVKEAIKVGGEPDAENRIRIIGYDDLLKEDEFKGFPTTCLTIPGNELHRIDGTEYNDIFRAFIHAPFKEHAEGERNDTSVGMQITLWKGEGAGRAMFLGDHCYPTVKRIFEISDDTDVQYNVLLAPHHCSKSVMYWQDEGEDEPKLKQDVLDYIEGAADSPGYIVASSEPIPSSNQPGDNPPHVKAKKCYVNIVADEFLCTQEHLDEDEPEPIVFKVTEDGFEYVAPEGAATQSKATLSAAVVTARGAAEPPSTRVGFGGAA